MDDLDFIVGLMACNREELGFIPATTVETRYVARGLYVLLPRRGYLLHGVPQAFQPLHISQACVEYDLRSRGYGRFMIDQIVERATTAHASGISLRCAETNESNEFWAAMGFEHIKTLAPDNKRKRRLNIWWMPITPSLFELDQGPAMVPED